MVKGYCKKHWNHEWLVILMMYDVSNKFLKISSTLLTASWLILSIDRSEPKFESHRGSKIRITLKNSKNFDVYC